MAGGGPPAPALPRRQPPQAAADPGFESQQRNLGRDLGAVIFSERVLSALGMGASWACLWRGGALRAGSAVLLLPALAACSPSCLSFW